MEKSLDLIFVSPSQIVPLLIGTIIWIGLASIGTLATPRDRLIEVNIFYGWAVISGVFTITGVLIRGPFFVIFLLAVFAALIGLILAFKRRQSLFIPGFWKILVMISVLCLRF